MYTHYAGLITTKDILPALFKILTGFLIFFLIMYLLMKNISKAGLLTTLTSFIYLFFGNIKNSFLKLPVLNIISHYWVYLPLVASILLFSFYLIRKVQQVAKMTLLLNILFIIYLFIASIELPLSLQKNNQIEIEKLFVGISNNDTLEIKKYPDIFYIVLDCMPSTSYQKEMLGRDNQPFINALRTKGFYVPENSTSNYNRTAFSLAATLNMNYLNYPNSANVTSPIDYNKALHQVYNSPVIAFLLKKGYQLQNLSIFDFPDQPAIRKENFLSASSSSMIFFNTFWDHFYRNIWRVHFSSNQKKTGSSIVKELKTLHESKKSYNQKILDSLFTFQVSNTTGKPFFVYAHLYLPHFPYFFDSTGREYSPDSLYTDFLITDRKKYAGYIAYTNQKVIAIIDSLFNKGAQKGILIFQSDHGIDDLDFRKRKDAFRNFSAIHFPDNNQEQLYDSMSNVNTFRIIFNKYFGQKLSLLPDSSIYVK